MSKKEGLSQHQKLVALEGRAAHNPCEDDIIAWKKQL